MSLPRAPLLALAVALVAVLLAGPAAAVGDVKVVGTATLTATTSTPTLNATDAIDSDDTLTPTTIVENETVENTTEDVVGTTNDTVDDSADLVNDTLDTTTSSVDDSTEMLAGDLLLDSSLSVEAALSAEVESDGVNTSTATPAPESPTATPAVGSGGAGGTGGLPIDGPSEPLLGGAMLGGAIALTGLAGRGLLLNRDAVHGPLRVASASIWDAVAGWRDRLAPLFGLLGYQRYDDSSPMDHEGRRRLAEAVRADPGIHLSAVSDRVDLPLSTARYHLRILEHEGLVRGVKLHGKRRYFPPDVEAETLVASLADEATANVLRSLVDSGPASVSELAERLDRDPSTVSHHLDRLADEGIVDRERAGRAVVSSAAPEVEAAVNRLRSDEPVAVARPAATD